MLNFISTPIGNLNDISLRAIEVITNSDYLYSEDTRKFKKLLNHINCKKTSKSLVTVYFLFVLQTIKANKHGC